MTEEWKTIQEFPRYSVSDFGRIKNNNLNLILTGGKDRDGYRQVYCQMERNNIIEEFVD